MVGPDVWGDLPGSDPGRECVRVPGEHRGELFPAEMFANMSPSANGRPSMPPQILAAAITLQDLHGLSDLETVQELRCDLRWEAGCGLGLHDMAFDPSLLAYFRRRLARSGCPNSIFEAVREVVKATGVLKGKHRRALDSTVLDDAVASQDTVTQIIAAVREVPGADAVAAAQCGAHDYTDPGKPPHRPERRAGPRRAGRRTDHGRAAAAGPPARPATRGEGRERGGHPGPGRRSGRRARRGLRRPRRPRRPLAHHPGHRPRADRAHRRPRSPPHPPNPLPPAGRIQGPPGVRHGRCREQGRSLGRLTLRRERRRQQAAVQLHPLLSGLHTGQVDVREVAQPGASSRRDQDCSASSW